MGKSSNRKKVRRAERDGKAEAQKAFRAAAIAQQPQTLMEKHGPSLTIEQRRKYRLPHQGEREIARRLRQRSFDRGF